MNRSDAILAIDTGLSACKAIVFRLDGELVAEAKRMTPVISSTAHGQRISEIDMAQLWNTICEVVAEVVACAKQAGLIVSCVGVCGHGNGLYGIDKDGNPVNTAITSMDCRAVTELKTISEEKRSFVQETSSQKLWAGQPGLILRWLKKNRPEQYHNICHILFCKDYLSFRLCGEIASDYGDSSASGLLEQKSRTFGQPIFDALDIPDATAKMPALLRGDAIRGHVTAEASRQTGITEGTPVIGGMFDVDACVYGSGAIEPKDVCSIAGTWNVNAAVSSAVNYCAPIRQSIWRTDGQASLRIDSSATSAVNIDWYLQSVLEKNNGHDEFANQVAIDSYSLQSPYFFPFIAGSLDERDRKASLLGLDSSCDNRKIYDAVTEGIAFAHRAHLENLEDCGVKMKTIRLSGGLGKSALFCQLLADLCAIQVIRSDVDQVGAFGIWASAVTALGVYPDMATAIRSRLGTRKQYAPDRERHKLFYTRYNKFKEYMQCPSLI